MRVAVTVMSSIASELHVYFRRIERNFDQLWCCYILREMGWEWARAVEVGTVA